MFYLIYSQAYESCSGFGDIHAMSRDIELLMPKVEEYDDLWYINTTTMLPIKLADWCVFNGVKGLYHVNTKIPFDPAQWYHHIQPLDVLQLI